MSKTFNLAIPFDFLLQAIAKLSPTDKQRLRQLLDAHPPLHPESTFSSPPASPWE